MGLLDIPNELVLSVAEFIDSQTDLSHLSQANSQLYHTLENHRYAYNVKHDSCSALFWAAFWGRDRIVRLCLQNGAPVDVQANEKDGRFKECVGATPLNLAASQGHESTVRLLVEMGADIERLCKKGKTPLRVAALNRNQAVISFLLKSGADVNAQDFKGYTPLIAAVGARNEAVVLQLLQNGASANVKDYLGYSPLLHAISHFADGIASLLVEHGADIHVNDGQGWNPLMVAAQEGNTSIIPFLV
ncbi:ankyrin repeat-containing domain protein [Aspergillus insuetus]